MIDLAGRVAIVTGSSRGIGAATAVALAAAGADVVTTSRRDAAAAEAVAQKIGALGRQSLAVLCDVARAEEATRLVEQTVAAFGRVDILVNNAGIARDGLVVRMRDADWAEVIAVNLTGTFHCTRAALKVMVRQRSGRIVNVSSMVGERGNAGQANYAAAKAGIVGFTRSVAREYASRGITANAVAPGFIETGMTADLPAEAREAFRREIPLGRYGRPEEVASLVCFLASDAAGYITGQVIGINGGLDM